MYGSLVPSITVDILFSFITKLASLPPLAVIFPDNSASLAYSLPLIVTPKFFPAANAQVSLIVSLTDPSSPLMPGDTITELESLRLL